MITQSIEFRIKRLERRNRCLSLLLIISVAALLAACSSLLAGDRVLRASALHITGANGAVMLELGQSEGSYGLTVRDAQGRVRAKLGHDDEGTGLYIKDTAGDTRAGMAHFAHGGSGFALHGAGLRGGAFLYHKGNGSLTFLDGDDKVQARFP